MTTKRCTMHPATNITRKSHDLTVNDLTVCDLTGLHRHSVQVRDAANDRLINAPLIRADGIVIPRAISGFIPYNQDMWSGPLGAAIGHGSMHAPPY